MFFLLGIIPIVDYHSLMQRGHLHVLSMCRHTLLKLYYREPMLVQVLTSSPLHIHCQVRHDQLMRQQEKMIQDMEKAVYRREAIMLK